MKLMAIVTSVALLVAICSLSLAPLNWGPDPIPAGQSLDVNWGPDPIPAGQPAPADAQWGPDPIGEPAGAR